MLTVSGLHIPSKVKAEGNGITVNIEANHATIGNEYISRDFQINDNKLIPGNITNKRTISDTIFTPAKDSEEFKIRVTRGAAATSPRPQAIDKSNWSAKADSFQNASGPNDGPAANLIDNNLNSIWHSNYGGGTGSQTFPYNVIFDLKKTISFQAFSYTPRQNGVETNGNIKDYELYYANTDEDLDFNSNKWIKIKSGSLNYDDVEPYYVNLDEKITANKVKLVAISAMNNDKFGGGAEFDLYENIVETKTKNDYEFVASDLQLAGNPKVEDTSATINNVEKTGKKLTFNFKPFKFKGVDYTVSEVIVMYKGDHFMRKYLEISVPDHQKQRATIDYIDLESLRVNDSDQKWTIPTNAGGVVSMERFKATLGQPVYIQGMFFGSEFPVADNEIIDNTAYVRYYSGKSFERLVTDKQASTVEGKTNYMTWPTVIGAARGTELSVIQSDFFEYINSIATPSEFRIQYNSWFDNMMLIDDDNILKSFIEVDKELNEVETRPLDSYVVDDGWNNYNKDRVVQPERSGNSLNKTGFWEFNTKFPKELGPSSELVEKFGSNFGVWIGPRGGYNFHTTLAEILKKSGKGSRAGDSVDVADRVYIKNFQDMVLDWQKKYKVNYWKWDGFADDNQYRQWSATNGVPSRANNHMIGGYHNMYHVTDLWEAWIDLFEAVRKSATELNLNKLWISLTCYVNPSPWYLQWGNSVWMQCVGDRGESGELHNVMDKMLTYRDSMYYDFIKNHQFQFPLKAIYNHDPIFGKEGTGITADSMTDEEFRNYLYAQAGRGTGFWELYYSDSLMTKGKYEATAEFLEWAEKNFHILKNAKMIGGWPAKSVKLSTHPSYTTAIGLGGNAYAYAGWDNEDGIITMRNSSRNDKVLTFRIDENIGASSSLKGKTLYRTTVHNFKTAKGTDEAYSTVNYGDEISITLKAGEVRVWQLSTTKDTEAPNFTRVFTDGKQTVGVRFNEKVEGLITVKDKNVSSINKSVDGITYYINLIDKLADGEELTINLKDIKDLSGNKISNEIATVIYHKDNKVLSVEEKTFTKAEIFDKSLTTNYGFTIAANVLSKNSGIIAKQDNAYALGINEDGYAYFKLNEAEAISKIKINDGIKHHIAGVKENNGILKLYVDGKLSASAYVKENRYFKINKANTIVGSDGFNATMSVDVFDTSYGYDKIANLAGSGQAQIDKYTNIALNKQANVYWKKDGTKATTSTDRLESMAVDGIKNNLNGNYVDFGADHRDESSYLQIDLGKISDIKAINLWRYWGNSRTYKGTVIALADNTDFNNSTIIYNSDKENFHGLGNGNDELYHESSAGKEIILDKILKARYVRVYMHGSDAGTTNHINEIEVIGYQEKDIIGSINITELVDKLIKLNTLDMDNYTTESAKVFKALLKNSYDVLTTLKSQEAVARELEKLNGIENNLVDISLLKAKVLAANKSLEKYTKDSSKTLVETIKAAELLYVDGKKDAIAAMLTQLDDEMQSTTLVLRGDVTALNELIESYKHLKETDYSFESWSEYQEKLQLALAIVKDNSNASQDDVNLVLKELEQAKNKLKASIVEPEVKKDELKALIEKVKTVNEEEFTKTTYAEFKITLERANAIYESDKSSQIQIDDVKAELQDKFDKLESRASLDKAIKLLAEIEDESLNAQDYNEQNWEKFDNLLIKLKEAVADNSDINNDQMNDLIQKVEEAKTALIKVIKVNKQDLLELYKRYENKQNDNYTSITWQGFRNALKVAKMIIDNQDATQQQIDNALLQLNKAITDLSKNIIKKIDPKPEKQIESLDIQDNNTAYIPSSDIRNNCDDPMKKWGETKQKCVVNEGKVIKKDDKKKEVKPEIKKTETEPKTIDNDGSKENNLLLSSATIGLAVVLVLGIIAYLYKRFIK